MSIVFVHGVNNRESDSYRAGVRTLYEFLAEYFGGVTINGKTLGSPPHLPTQPPYWGDLGASFAWGMDSLPKGDLQALGGAGNVDDAALIALIRDALPGPMGNEPLTELAKHDFRAAIDVVAELAIKNPGAGNNAAADTAKFIMAISEYAKSIPSPPWLANVANDQTFINELQIQVKQHQGGVQALGGGLLNNIKQGVLKLKQSAQRMAGSALNKAGDFASTKALARSRESLNGILGRFFGDIFIYFDGRGDKNDPGEIPKRIIVSLDEAIAKAPDEPLVLIGHSLGGVISYDILSHFRPDIEIDLFITVGSQVAHFEEMKLYHASKPGVKKPQKVAKPDNILNWINVYDEVDIFAYGVKGVFDGVNFDLHYDTGTYVIKAHSAYFEQAEFYERLVARVNSL